MLSLEALQYRRTRLLHHPIRRIVGGEVSFEDLLGRTLHLDYGLGYYETSPPCRYDSC